MTVTAFRLACAILAFVAPAASLVGVASATDARPVEVRVASDLNTYINDLPRDGFGRERLRFCDTMVRYKIVLDPITGERKIVNLPSPCAPN